MPSEFRLAFEVRARTVRRSLFGRRALDALTAASGLAVLGAGAAWAFRAASPGPSGLSVLGVGVVLSLVHAARRRWSDADTALYLDARLTHDEAIATALERDGAADPVATDVSQRATRALRAADALSFRPAWLRRRHALLPAALAALLAVSLAPRRPAAVLPEQKAPPVVAKLDGLTRVEALARLEAQPDGERERLEALAAAARKLREDAARGMERRDALDRLGRLGEQLDAQERALADAENRAGLEAAVRVLAREGETEAAARALGRADLVAFDEELRKLAESAETRSQDVARRGLEDAAAAATAKGAPDVARALEEQKRLLKQRGAQSEALAELSRLLGEGLKEGSRERRQLETLGRSSAGTEEALARAMVDALKKLDEAERRRLAEALAKTASGMADGPSLTREELERLARALASPAGHEALTQALSGMAKEGNSMEAARAQAMAMARLGVAEAERALQGEQGNPGAEAGERPGAGPGGPAGHAGTTPPVDAPDLTAQVRGLPQGGIPVGAEGFSPGRAGELLPAPSPAALEAARPREVSAMEGAFVPREYREQVGRYFARTPEARK